jgi:hypothetical protein
VATAETSVGRWIVLDPDFGVAIPYDLGTLTADRALLETYYARHLERHPWAMYTSATPTVTYGGALVRYPKACRIERLSYIVKWLGPVVLGVLGFAGLRFARRRQT